VHPEDIRGPFRLARDHVARALAVLTYVEKLRREDERQEDPAKRINGDMRRWLTEEVSDHLGVAHHEASTGLINAGGPHG